MTLHFSGSHSVTCGLFWTPIWKLERKPAKENILNLLQGYESGISARAALNTLKSCCRFHLSTPVNVCRILERFYLSRHCLGLCFSCMWLHFTLGTLLTGHRPGA
eukprot:202170-Amphidinium_carterae.1